MLSEEYPRLGERVSRCRLPSGLEVMAVAKPEHRKSFALVSARYGGMDLRYRIGGARRETPAGVAHYLEHKLGDNREGDPLLELARLGASDNAFTSCFSTAYYFSCTEHFYESLRVLLGYVARPWFTEESVEKERGIIAQEIRMGDNDPGLRVHLNLLRCLYREHPVRVPVTGSVESIERITPSLLYDCYHAFYTPENMVLVAVGNVSLEKIAAMAEEFFPGKSAPAVERDYGGEEGRLPCEKSVTEAMPVSMPTFLAGYKCRPVGEGEDFLRARLLGDLACDALFGDGSPLFHRLYREGMVSGGLYGGLDMLPGAAYVYVGGDAKDPQAVYEAVTVEAERLAREGIDGDYFQRLRRGNYGELLRELDSFENIAVNLAEGYLLGYDYYRFPELFDSLTKEAAEGFLRENFSEENSAISVIKPCEKG